MKRFLVASVAAAVIIGSFWQPTPAKARGFWNQDRVCYVRYTERERRMTRWIEGTGFVSWIWGYDTVATEVWCFSTV